MRTLHPLCALLAVGFVASTASSAAAHCCHDTRMLGARQQSELRPGLHSLNDGNNNKDSIWGDPPSGSGTGSNGVGGLGQMHGNSVGAYGAGSVGQIGPGGLGSMRSGGLGQPPGPPPARSGQR